MNEFRGITLSDAFSRIYPETSISGFSRHHITACFYNLLNSIIAQDSVVVDPTAERGQIERTAKRHLKDLISLKGKALITLNLDEAARATGILSGKSLTHKNQDIRSQLLSRKDQQCCAGGCELSEKSQIC